MNTCRHSHNNKTKNMSNNYFKPHFKLYISHIHSPKFKELEELFKNMLTTDRKSKKIYEYLSFSTKRQGII